MTIGYRTLLRNTPDAGGGGDRLAAIEQRLAKLADAVTTVASSTAQRQKEDETNAEVARAQRLVSDAESKVATAKAELTAAYESGDAARISDATAKLTRFTTEATAAGMNFNSVKARAKNPPAQQPATPAGGQTQTTVDDTNLREFRTANEWYDTDPDMTAAAKKAHREIAAEGLLDVGSKAYFNAIEARVRAQFPDRVRAQPAGAFTPPRGATMTTRADDQADRIPASIAEGYRKMGIDIDNADVAKKMVEARKIAVAKNFLPEKPVLDRVVTR
jgi:hypothetical protein